MERIMNGINEIKMLSGAKPFESITNDKRNYIFIVTDDISNDILGVYDTMQKGKDCLMAILSNDKDLINATFDLIENSDSLFVVKNKENDMKWKIERFKVN